MVALPERYAVPAPSVRLNLETSTAPTFSLNRTDMVPLPVWYVAFRNAGFVPSCTVTFLPLVAALEYPLTLVTAPSPNIYR